MNSSFSLNKIFPKTAPASSDGFSRVRIAADGSVEAEGQLAVDVYQNEDSIVIIAPLAGVRHEDLELKITDDLVTIEGIRRQPDDLPTGNFLVQECFWGRFSRSIILPAPTENENVKAEFKDGVLRIAVPKSTRLKTKVIKIEV